MKSLYKIRTSILYVALISVIMLALGSLALRFLFSTIESYRGDVESTVGSTLNQPVSIKSIKARFIGFSPSLVLQNITLLNGEDNRPFAHFEELAIVLDVINSLSSQRIIFDRIEIKGANLIVERQSGGEISIGGVVGNDVSDEDSEQQNSEVGGWLLSHPNLIIKNSQLLIIDKKAERLFDFSDVTLRLHNAGDRHQLFGQLMLPENLGNEIEFIASINGDFTSGGNFVCRIT